MGVEPFVTPADIIAGNKNLNLAFCADMFNKVSPSGCIIRIERCKGEG